MRAIRLAKAIVTIAVASAIAGAVAGLLVAVFIGVIKEGRLFDVPGVYSAAAVIGAICGAVLGPVASFGFMRRVPLGRLFAETAAGTTAGGLLGFFFLPGGLDRMLVLAAAGFLIAGARLAWVYRPVRDAPIGTDCT